MKNTIPEQLRALRVERELTITELANLTGIRRPNIVRLESGTHSPQLSTLERVADALGVEIVLKKKDEIDAE